MKKFNLVYLTAMMFLSTSCVVSKFKTEFPHSINKQIPYSNHIDEKLMIIPVWVDQDKLYSVSGIIFIKRSEEAKLAQGLTGNNTYCLSTPFFNIGYYKFLRGVYVVSENGWIVWLKLWRSEKSTTFGVVQHASISNDWKQSFCETMLQKSKISYNKSNLNNLWEGAFFGCPLEIPINLTISERALITKFIGKIKIYKENKPWVNRIDLEERN